MTHKLAFLDRDGTINIDFGYVTEPSKIKLIKNVADAISELRKNSFRIIIVTNQSAISRGMASIEDVNLTNQELLKQLESENSNAKIDQILLSPAKPGDNDDTRKPQTGMLKDLECDYDRSNSIMVGDKISDVEFGINAGLKKENCFLINSEKEESKEESQNSVQDLSEVVKIILSRQP